MADGEKGKTVAAVAHLRESIPESLEQGFPVVNQGRHGFGQVPSIPGKHGFIRQQLQQGLKFTCPSRLKEFRNHALVLLSAWPGGGFPGRNPLPSTSQDLAAVLFAAVHDRSNI